MQFAQKLSSSSHVTVQRRTIKCAALPDRRAVLFGAMLPAFLMAPKAMALIPDEEDEELVERAKANRAARLAQQKATTNAFMAEEGLTNRKLDQNLIPVQKAVYKLAESGAQLESGDVKAASRTLSEGWVNDFSAAATKVSGSADAVLTALSTLQAATNKGDLVASKKSYVALVDAVQTWATASGLSASLKGL